MVSITLQHCAERFWHHRRCRRTMRITTAKRGGGESNYMIKLHDVGSPAMILSLQGSESSRCADLPGLELASWLVCHPGGTLLSCSDRVPSRRGDDVSWQLPHKNASHRHAKCSLFVSRDKGSSLQAWLPLSNTHAPCMCINSFECLG